MAGLHLLAQSAHLLQGPEPVAVRRGGPFQFARHTANLGRERLEIRHGPSFGDQQLSLSTRELEDISLAAPGDVDAVEVGRELSNEPDQHQVYRGPVASVAENLTTTRPKCG